MHAPEAPKRAALALCVGALAALLGLAAGCISQDQRGKAQSGKEAQAAQEAPTQGDKAAEPHWVTTRVEVPVNRPGRPERWVRITAGEPAVLARGEWLMVQGKKCVGRADGATEIHLAPEVPGALAARNCR